MMGANRIPGVGRLTPARTARFTFDGRTLTALEGDTVASALLANGIHLVGRSFKYHRPRGILSAGAEEPNALLDISRDASRKQPNVRASVQEVFDGMIASSQNRWPNLAFDVGGVNNWMSPFFAAGFYYKTFMWPKSAWKKFYEPRIRAAAGLGGALHYDKSVKIDGQDGFAWAQATAARLAAMDNVTVLTRTTAFGYYAQNF